MLVRSDTEGAARRSCPFWLLSGFRGSVIAFKEMMGMKMKKVRSDRKSETAEEIAPEEVESITQTTDEVDAVAAAAAGPEVPQSAAQH